MKNKIKIFLTCVRNILFKKKDTNKMYLYVNDLTPIEKYNEIIKRFIFFGIDVEVTKINNIKLSNLFDFSLIGCVDQIESNWRLLILNKLKQDLFYNFDYDKFYLDGWEYHRLLTFINKKEVEYACKVGKETIVKIKNTSPIMDKVYVFGTGPSLEKAIDREWKNGVIVVSNTIVKDEELWNHLKPNFIVAGDAIYHFGIGNFAKKFRRDLKLRLEETDTYFIFPSNFYPFCVREMPDFVHRFIPVPIHNNWELVHHDLSKNYFLPSLGNVLPLLLLPVGCTFSKNIYLTGFDGRAPSDKMFWKNSDRHFYNSDVPQLTELHPAFYNKLVPKDNQNQYVKTVHGDSLENALLEAEKVGFIFKMTHFSYTENLNKRFNE